MNNNYLRIGTRSSDLAIWQANHLAQQLHCKGIDTKLILADDNADNALIGKFSDEVEQLLLSNKVDIAVHSLKDLDTKPKEGLVIAGLSSRANPSDLLIIHPEFYDESQLFKIKNTTVIGTSAERRKYQILLFRPDLIVQNIRGNITERIALLRESKIGAIILAKAGIDRLDMDLVDLKTIILHPREFTPAAGQGILAYQVKTENIYVRKLLMQIHNYDVAQCSNVERKILHELHAGCKSPFGVFCEKDVRGMFHCHLFAQYEEKSIKVKYSQSTTFGLVEEVLKQYHQQLAIT